MPSMPGALQALYCLILDKRFALAAPHRALASPGPRFTAVDFSGGFCYTRAVDRAISRWTPDTRQEEALSKTQSHGCAQRDFIT